MVHPSMEAPLERAVLRLPESCRDGLLNYLRFGLRPGSFLTAVLSNDLRGACAAADDINRLALYDYVYVLYNAAPLGAWGSPELVAEWLQRGAELRQADPHIDISQWITDVDGNSAA
jgi:hypothetical protein